jgi:hypothetical protein
MLVSALLLPITVITVLMLMAGSYGTSTFDPVGFLIIVVAPPATLVAGLGLLLRWRWARFYIIAMLAIIIVANVSELSKGGKTTTIRTTPAGVTTSEDVWGGPNYHSVPIIVFCSDSLVLIFLPFVRREFHPPAKAPAGPSGPVAPEGSLPPPAPGERDWRVGHKGRDLMYYEEWHHGAWQRLTIDGEMLTGRAHHVIYFDPVSRWQSHPEWARHRRDEIMARIKSQFRASDYEYQDGLPGAPVPPVVPAVPPVTTPAATPKQWAAFWLFVVIFFALAIRLGWLVQSGIETGTTIFPSKRPTLQRPVSLKEEPVNFWLVIAVYSAGSLGAGWAALWFLREGIRLKRS